jgi:16S rRNA processing protein RimM
MIRPASGPADFFMEKLTEIGFVSKAHGFGGDVLCVLTRRFTLPLKLQFLFLSVPGGPVPFFIERLDQHEDAFVVKFEDVGDEAAARKLSGMKVLVESGYLRKASHQNEWQRLTGYEAVDGRYGSLGSILAIEEMATQAVARCEVNGKEVLFPLATELIAAIDDKKRVITLHLPEGLLDIYLGDAGSR